MKKRIISAILVIVMSIMALVSCAPAFDFAEEDLSQYVTFNYDKFMEEIKKLEIELDHDYVSGENDPKVLEDLRSSITTAIINGAIDADKKDKGAVGDSDVVYYCYYATDGKNVFYFNQMDEAAITGSKKAEHVIKLGAYDEDDEFEKKLAEALLKDGNYNFGENGENAYDMSKSGDVELGETIVISYKREYNVYKKNADGEYLDKDGQVTTEKKNYVIEKTVAEKCSFQVVDLGEVDLVNGDRKTDPIVYYIAQGVNDDTYGAEHVLNYFDKYDIKAGSQVISKEKKDESIVTKKEFNLPGYIYVADGDSTKTEEVEFKYTSVKVEFRIDNYPTPVTVTHKPFDKETKEYPDGLHVDNTTGKITLNKDTELTYYVFPVHYLSVPAVTAESIIQYVVAKSISKTYFDVFYDDYKNGEKNVETMTTEIKNLISETYDTTVSSQATLAALKKAVTDAEAVVKADKADGKTALPEHEKAVSDATLKYKTEQRAAIATAVSTLTAATFDGKTLGQEIYNEHIKDTYKKLKTNYENEVTEGVEEALYELIFENEEICKLTGTYPEKLVKEFKKHIYDSYEYDFYHGTTTTTVSGTSATISNYLAYGNLEAFLSEKTGAMKSYGTVAATAKEAIDMAITDEAKEAIAPLLKLYAVSKKLGDMGVAAEVVKFVNLDVEAGAYDAHYKENRNYTAEQNAAAEAQAVENAAKSKESAIKNAPYFLVTDKVLKDYKKELGSSVYRSYEDQYGEINIRASLQFNRLFYYLTSIDLKAGDNETEYVYTADGKISFRTIKYTVKAD